MGVAVWMVGLQSQASHGRAVDCERRVNPPHRHDALRMHRYMESCRTKSHIYIHANRECIDMHTCVYRITYKKRTSMYREAADDVCCICLFMYIYMGGCQNYGPVLNLPIIIRHLIFRVPKKGS